MGVPYQPHQPLVPGLEPPDRDPYGEAEPDDDGTAWEEDWGDDVPCLAEQMEEHRRTTR
jgi:hypothetical protein